MKKTKTHSIHSACSLLLLLLLLTAFSLHAATVTGYLTDITVGALNTKLTFAPTNDVLVTPSGLSAGPPKVIETASGSFSLTLEAGDYTVSLPLIPWRRPFGIAVPSTNGTLNITNLLTNPHTYTYTNNLSYTVKATTYDSGPDVLDAKIAVAGTLKKLLATNAGAVSVVLSNPAPLQLNPARVICWSTNGETTLLTATPTIAAGALHSGSLITIEAFGSFADPGGNAPIATISLKLGAATVVSQSKPVNNANWKLSAALTVRATGVSGSVAGAFALVQDNTSDPFTFESLSATVNTTTSLDLSLTAAIDDYTGEERVACEQLVVRID
jgi:hypothetical protein